jgi:hypothetical protein
VEDGLAEPEDKIEIKEKTEEILVKQELSDSTKRPNLRIMGIEEGEEV